MVTVTVASLVKEMYSVVVAKGETKAERLKAMKLILRTREDLIKAHLSQDQLEAIAKFAKSISLDSEASKSLKARAEKLLRAGHQAGLWSE